MDTATVQLLHWALATLGSTNASHRLSQVAGDASNRRYFRLSLGGSSYMLVHAPPATEKNAEFLAVRELLDRAGLCVPALLGADLERGYLLLGDLGDRLLLDELDEHSVDSCYRRAFTVLERLAEIDPGDPVWPAYDRALLSEELDRFPRWFVQELLDSPWTEAEQERWRPLVELLVANALEQPRVLVHRDFHSRNLMPQADGRLGVIDFQDAVMGPVTYDLVSLLRDCYCRWPAEQVEAWALEYLHLRQQAGTLSGIREAEFLRWFDLTGLQRHIKVLGTFARLNLRDGKAGYLEDLPLVLRYVREMLGKYSPGEAAVAGFAAWFEDSLVPAIRQQPWGAMP